MFNTTKQDSYIATNENMVAKPQLLINISGSSANVVSS